MSDIDTAVVDGLKALDPKRPIREADIAELGEQVRLVQILLQKSLMASTNNDSVAVAMRFAAEAGDDGAGQSRPRATVLLI